MTKTTPTGSVGSPFAGRLVERWIPGGTSSLDSLRALANRHRLAVVVLIIALATVIATVVVLTTRQPAVEAPPSLPPAISAAPTTATPAPPTTLVISVVGKVTNPGLVTLTDGARVADAIRAAGGVLPGTD
ncbi:MAG TPA: SLBB domain-containing protein, partial [Pseudonocardiaceae bacterium]